MGGDSEGITARLMGDPLAAARGAAWRYLTASIIIVSATVLGACPAPAGASAILGPAQIMVRGRGAGALITRAPFQISFTDAHDRPVLSEVPAQNTGFTLPPALPGTSSGPTGPALYAPLSFLVGVDQPATYPCCQSSGNLLSDEETGTEYSAQEVLTAVPAGEGVELTVSTDDPSGRQLTVTIEPDGSGAIRVTATTSDPTGVAAMADSFSSSPEEAFHGFGGRHNALDQHGQDFYNWVNQENVGEGPQEKPGETNLLPNGPQGAYYVQSSFVSNKGYGFLLDQSQLSTWRLDSEKPDAWQSEVAAPEISYVVAPGRMTRAITTLTSITGRQRVPPTWALGPMFDREVELFETPSQYEHQIEADLTEIESDQLPVEAYRIEGWAFLPKPFLESVITRLRTLGIRPLVYFRPFVGRENLGTEYPTEYNVAIQNGYVTTTAGGKPFQFLDNFLQDAALIDFTNPAAVKWWRERIDAALELGAEGCMLDFGEQVQPGMHFSDGATGDEMHNAYPVLYEKVTREAVDAYESLHPGRSIVFFTRSGYTGEPGSTAYENFNFPGDETTNWSQASGLASLTRDMLNRAIGGAYGYGTDIGGYYDLGGLSRTTRELFLRWTEWAALSPVFRLHGAIIEEHTPWAPAIDALTLYKQFSRLHIKAQGLITALWRQAERTGLPVTRPLYLAYPNDAQAALQDQEWLLGPDVLVAPVVTQGANSRPVYFPEGCWRDPETGQRVLGSRYETVQADIEQLPYFFRCGTRPFNPAVRPPPTVILTTPAEKASYSYGQTVDANYSCTAGTGATLESCSGPVKPGQQIGTTHVGEHEFTVTARDVDGLYTSVTHRYRVTRAMATSLTAAPQVALFAAPISIGQGVRR